MQRFGQDCSHPILEGRTLVLRGTQWPPWPLQMSQGWLYAQVLPTALAPALFGVNTHSAAAGPGQRRGAQLAASAACSSPPSLQCTSALTRLRPEQRFGLTSSARSHQCRFLFYFHWRQLSLCKATPRLLLFLPPAGCLQRRELEGTVWAMPKLPVQMSLCKIPKHQFIACVAFFPFLLFSTPSFSFG